MALTQQEISDRLEIMAQIYTYCRAVDRIDVELGYSVFHPDSRAIFPNFENSGHNWIDTVCKLHRGLLYTSHQVTNVIINVNGDRAGSEAYVTARNRLQEGDKVVERLHVGRYVDEWSRRDGLWKIDKRECVIDFNSSSEVTQMYDAHRARRDKTDPSYAVLQPL